MSKQGPSARSCVLAHISLSAFLLLLACDHTVGFLKFCGMLPKSAKTLLCQLQALSMQMKIQLLMFWLCCESHILHVPRGVQLALTTLLLELLQWLFTSAYMFCYRTLNCRATESIFPQPLSVNYKGVDVHEMPPNGQGIAALMALKTLRQALQ